MLEEINNASLIFKNNFKKLTLLNILELLFFLSIGLIQYFLIPKIFENANKIFEIIQQTQTKNLDLTSLKPEMLQTEALTQYNNSILYLTSIDLLLVLFSVIIFQTTIWYFLHKTIQKTKLNLKLLIIPVIYFVSALFLIFLLTPQIYMDPVKAMLLLFFVFTAFIYANLFFYSSINIKKSFTELLILPFKTHTFLLPFLLVFIISLILLYLFTLLTQLNSIVGILFFASVILWFFQLSRVFLVLTVKKLSKNW